MQAVLTTVSCVLLVFQWSAWARKSFVSKTCLGLLAGECIVTVSESSCQKHQYRDDVTHDDKRRSRSRNATFVTQQFSYRMEGPPCDHPTFREFFHEVTIECDSRTQGFETLFSFRISTQDGIKLYYPQVKFLRKWSSKVFVSKLKFTGFCSA